LTGAALADAARKYSAPMAMPAAAISNASESL
jgi:hypothetical protein